MIREILEVTALLALGCGVIGFFVWVLHDVHEAQRREWERRRK
jgi:signal transduction histidine kinase